MKLLKSAILVTVISLLSACSSAPKSNPAASKQDGDAGLNCDYIVAEYKGNTVAANNKMNESKNRDAKDSPARMLKWPSFKKVPGKEANDLLDRNVWLKSLFVDKDCGVTEWPEQPKGY